MASPLKTHCRAAPTFGKQRSVRAQWRWGSGVHTRNPSEEWRPDHVNNAGSVPTSNKGDTQMVCLVLCWRWLRTMCSANMASCEPLSADDGLATAISRHWAQVRGDFTATLCEWSRRTATVGMLRSVTGFAYRLNYRTEYIARPRPESARAQRLRRSGPAAAHAMNKFGHGSTRRACIDITVAHELQSGEQQFGPLRLRTRRSGESVGCLQDTSQRANVFQYVLS